jgi:hypothetical protein
LRRGDTFLSECEIDLVSILYAPLEGSQRVSWSPPWHVPCPIEKDGLVKHALAKQISSIFSLETTGNVTKAKLLLDKLAHVF